MTENERLLADLGLEYAEGAESYDLVKLPGGGEVRKTDRGTWEAVPYFGDGTANEYDSLASAVRAATPPKAEPASAADADAEDEKWAAKQGKKRQDFAAAIEAVRCGAAVRTTARAFGIPESTLRNRIAKAKARRLGKENENGQV